MSLILITHAVISAFDGNSPEVPLRSVYTVLSQLCTDDTVLLQSGIRANQHWQQLPGTHSRTAPIRVFLKSTLLQVPEPQIHLPQSQHSPREISPGYPARKGNGRLQSNPVMEASKVF